MPTTYAPAGEIYYEALGEGPVVVFAHGAGGNTLSWYQQVPVFSRRYRVITLDFRGFGRSRRPVDELDIRELARDIEAVLDAEAVERCALVAHDLGGFAAMRLALERPERVRCLAIASSAGGLLTPTMLASMSDSSLRYSREGGGLELVTAPGWVEQHPAEAFLMEQIYGLNDPIEPTLMARLVEGRIQTEELAGYDTPTLVLGGGRDVLLGPGALDEAVRLIPGAKHVVFPEAGHSLHFEQPDEFNRVIAEFLAQHVAG